MDDRTLAHVVAVAQGGAPADLLITGARVVNVFTDEVTRTSVALAAGYVAGFGPHDALAEVDAAGAALVPGFTDAHVHLESSMVTPAELARAVVPRGTTAVVTDAHEIANVHGVDGVAWVLAATEGLPLDVYLMLPSCVPATPLETSGADLSAEDLAIFADHPRVLGLGEVMNAPAVLHGSPGMLRKLALTHDGLVDGHAVGLAGRALEAYAAAGVSSDHESVTLAQGRERVRVGLHVMIREGTTEANLEALLPLLMGAENDRVMLCTDDRHPHDLLERGHIDDVLRRAVAWGAPPLVALRAATLHPSRYLRLARRGAVAPGYRADLALVDDLARFRVTRVWKAGRLVAADGELVGALPPTPPLPGSGMNLAWRGEPDLVIPAREGEARVIGVIPDQVLTRALAERPRVVDGVVEADPARDLLKLAVVERHRGTGNVGLGLVRGFGLKSGALASSVAHDSHNIIVVGASDADMVAAVEAVAAAGGGLAVAHGGKVHAFLSLPIAGLMSRAPLEAVAAAIGDLNRAAALLGCVLRDPFMTLSFLALPPIPELKLTDRGLVETAVFAHVPLFLGQGG